jgi:hypothetical protein
MAEMLTAGRRRWLAEAMNQVQRAATVGASRERRCQRVRGFLVDVVRWLRVALRGGVWVAVVTVSLSSPLVLMP